MLSIQEILINAKINLCDNHRSEISGHFGREQLSNAVTLIEKDYPLDYEVDIDGLIEKYGSLDRVPEYPEGEPHDEEVIG